MFLHPFRLCTVVVVCFLAPFAQAQNKTAFVATGTGLRPSLVVALLHPPGPLWMFEALFEEVNLATGFPLSLFPGLNGSDKTKFVNDQLINREELIHLTAFLEGQLYIAIQFVPDLVEFRQQQVNNSKFLLRYFQSIASATDAKGSKAISLENIEQLYVPPSNERTRVGADSKLKQ